jgi:hypothetical protein
VRVRTTVAAVVVAGLAMAVGGLVLVAVLRDTLTREVEAAARLRAEDVVSLLASDPAGQRSLAVDDPEEWIIQVLDEGGQVVRSSPNAEGVGPVARPRPGESSEIAVEAGGPIEEDGTWPWPSARAPRRPGGRAAPRRAAPRRAAPRRAGRRPTLRRADRRAGPRWLDGRWWWPGPPRR